jgi:hypothetical protein
MPHIQPSLLLRLAEVLLYLLPSSIALVRRPSHLGTGFAINLLLGWTVVGWMYSLAWAAFSDKRGVTQGEVQLVLQPEKASPNPEFSRVA